jgi:RHS repeat-associated protein
VTQQESTYYPFGSEQRAITSTVDNRYRFTGLERDAETGLDHTQFRKYSPLQARWLTPDPVCSNCLDPQQLNRYSYVRNNPVNFIDPDGLFAPGPGLGSPPWVDTTPDPLWYYLWLWSGGAFGGKHPGGSSRGGGAGSGSTTQPQLLPYDKVRELVKDNNLSQQSDEMIACIVFMESGFRPDVYTNDPNSTASGLMGITKTAFRQMNPRMKQEDIDTAFASGGAIFDPGINVLVGSGYLAVRIQWANGDVHKALAGYGTGARYADRILECEKGLKGLRRRDTPYSILLKLHSNN